MGGAPTQLRQRLTAVGEDQAAQDLDDWTDKRHAIVHRGQRPPINREPARCCVELVTRLVTAVDVVAVAAKQP